MSSPLLGERTRRRFSFLINFAFWALWLTLFFVAGRVLIRLLAPFVAAFLLAMLLQRPLRFLERRFAWRHGFAATVLVVCALVLLLGAAGALCWQGALCLLRLLQNEETLTRLAALGAHIGGAASALLLRIAACLPPEFAAAVEQTAETLGDTVYRYAAGALSSLSASLMNFTTGVLPQFLLALLFFILAAVFFTRDYHSVTAFVRRQIPPPQQPLAAAAVKAGKETVCGIFRAYVLLGVLIFAALCAGFWLLGVPHPILLAVLTTLVDILPILGIGTVLLPFAAFRLLCGNITGGVLLLLLYAVITVARNLLQPRLVSRQTGLPPLLTLLTMYAGWRAAGLIGLLFAPVLAMIVLRLEQDGYLHLFR